jgi:hypothetical protein
MSKLVAPFVVMRLLSAVACGPWGGEDQRTYHPATTPKPHK